MIQWLTVKYLLAVVPVDYQAVHCQKRLLCCWTSWSVPPFSTSRSCKLFHNPNPVGKKYSTDVQNSCDPAVPPSFKRAGEYPRELVIVSTGWLLCNACRGSAVDKEKYYWQSCQVCQTCRRQKQNVGKWVEGEGHSWGFPKTWTSSSLKGWNSLTRPVRLQSKSSPDFLTNWYAKF